MTGLLTNEAICTLIPGSISIPAVFLRRVTVILNNAMYGAQNEAYRMMEGRKVGKVVSLQRVIRSLMVEAPQNETFTLV